MDQLCNLATFVKGQPTLGINAQSLSSWGSLDRQQAPRPLNPVPESKPRSPFNELAQELGA
ncbi:MAG: hypothetical protein AAFW95_12995 [Cyanobacteria bacterium J06638_6]